jgi:hypothetical protein
MTEQQKSPLEVAAHLTGSVAFLYLVSWWGFHKEIKQEVWDRQGGICGEPGCDKAIKEFHHRVPSKALNKYGIKGKDTAENAVGLCFNHHKNKWDQLMFEKIIYPGIPLEDVPPDIYTKISYTSKSKSRRKKHHRRAKSWR